MPSARTPSPQDDRLFVNRRIQIPYSEFDFSFERSSGPGGQNVNKVASKARLRWNIAASPSLPDDVRERAQAAYRRRITQDGDLILTSQRYRDQPRNLQDCLEKLRELLAAVALPPKPRKPTRPSRAAQRRRVEEKRKQSEKKQRRRPPPQD